ncbi:hypothetical protein H5410_021015, partial [Solanum commersonii]
QQQQQLDKPRSKVSWSRLLIITIHFVPFRLVSFQYPRKKMPSFPLSFYLIKQQQSQLNKPRSKVSWSRLLIITIHFIPFCCFDHI